MEHLSQNFHCLAPDLLGCGDSDRPKIHYSISLQSECLLQFLDTLQLRQVWLVGHEIGGWVAAHFALHHPERVAGLVLIGAEGVIPAEAKNRWSTAWWLTMNPPLLAMTLRSLRPLAAIIGKHRDIDRLLRWRHHLLQSQATCQMLFRRRPVEIQSELMHDLMADLKPPILILQGEGDRSLAVARDRRYAHAPTAEVRLIPDGDASSIQTQPEAVAKLLNQFLTTGSYL
jgi:pimeloyl-ACP methyl ester carboxylesterase